MKKKLLLFTAVLFSAILMASCSQTAEPVEKDVIPVEEGVESSAVPEKNPEPEIIEYRTSFIGCGDNIIYGTKDARGHAEGTDRPYNYKPYYNGVADIIENADIAFINQETLMCGEGYALSYYPMFNSPQELGYDLKELGFDVVNISNNHMLDRYFEGMINTVNVVEEYGFDFSGANRSAKERDRPVVVEVNGICLGMICCTQMTNGMEAYCNRAVKEYGVNYDILREIYILEAKMELLKEHLNASGGGRDNMLKGMIHATRKEIIFFFDKVLTIR